MRLAYVLVGLILLGELPSMGRTRAEGRSGDRGSYPFIMLLMTAGYWCAFYVAGWSAGNPFFRAAHSDWFFGAWSAWVGATLTIGGTAFRQWAILTLGRYFTRQVLVSSDQPVVETGPYRWIRHPSYTGAILQAAGIGLALGNWVSFGCLLAAISLSFGYRIHVEEKSLLAAIGEPYRAYRLRTKRLIPFVW